MHERTIGRPDRIRGDRFGPRGSHRVGGDQARLLIVFVLLDDVQIQLFRTARHMRRGKILIGRLRTRIAGMMAKGQSIGGAEAMLETFEATKRMLEEHERQLHAQLIAQRT